MVYMVVAPGRVLRTFLWDNFVRVYISFSIAVYIMSSIIGEEHHSPAKKPRLSTKWSHCIICQVPGGTLVSEPTLDSCDILFNGVNTMSQYGNKSFPEIAQRFSTFDSSTVVKNKASWHRQCYSAATNKTEQERARKRYENQLKSKQSDMTASCSYLTRQHSEPFNKSNCFFCQSHETKKFPLSKLRHIQSAINLQKAIDLHGNEHLKLRIDSGIDSIDLTKMNILYHNGCWTEHVTNKLKTNTNSSVFKSNLNSKIQSEIEFAAQVKCILRTEDMVCISTLSSLFKCILEKNGVDEVKVTNRYVKQILTSKVQDVIFSKPLRQNEPERVSLSHVKDKAFQLLQKVTSNQLTDETLFDVAKYLRKSILESDNWTFRGSLDMPDNLVPKQLTSFFHMLLTGKSDIDYPPTPTLRNRSANLAQHTMYACLSGYSKVQTDFKHIRDFPLQVGVGLTLHSTFRNKELIDFFHGLCLSIDYRKVIQIENKIANQTIIEMPSTNYSTIFVPRNFIQGRYVFFAIDNCEFNEDTLDGKNTLHGTVMNIYQCKESVDELKPIIIGDIDGKTLHTSNIIPSVSDCNISTKCKPPCPKFQTYKVDNNETALRSELSWLVSTALILKQDSRVPMYPLTWSAYNSVIHEETNITQIATPPLLDAPAHEFSTLMSVFKQASQINHQIVGPDRKTVISLDLGLYVPAQKLIMSKPEEFKHIILRPGELHIVMAMLRTVGAFVDNSGIDSLWLHSGLYGQNTIKQIIDGNHVKRGLKVHLVTLISLTQLYLDALFNEIQLSNSLAEHISEVQNCSFENRSRLKEVDTKLHECLNDIALADQMLAFAEGRGPTCKAILVYMKMALCMLKFVRSVRSGNWELHLEALSSFCGYFFAFDRLNYARMIPLYLSQMRKLQEDDPGLWREFQSGNWVVNKSHTAFCSLGADHALEQTNKWMKIAGGIVGITRNPQARTRYFLVAPELTRLKDEAKLMANILSVDRDTHHEINKMSVKTQAENANALIKTIRDFVDPFLYEGNDMINIATNAIMTQTVENDILALESIGETMANDFIENRLQKNAISLWGPMKKAGLKLWRYSMKQVTLPVQNRLIALKEDRGLFARLLIVANSRKEVSLENVLSEYELSVVPRSLFNADGLLHKCLSKSTLMNLLREKSECNFAHDTGVFFGPRNREVAVVDAMNVLQCLQKPSSMKTGGDLADHFVSVIQSKFEGYKEVHLIFDRYDVPSSLKTATRIKRLGNKKAMSYHVTDTTTLQNVPMSSLLSSSSTKDELTAYLAEKTIEKLSDHACNFVVSFRDKVMSTKTDFSYLSSSHEEADTKILLHATDCRRRGTTLLDIHSQDTDVFVLCLRRFTNFLPVDTLFISGSDKNKCHTPLKGIIDSIGVEVAAALPAIHALSGADITGSFMGKGKTLFWKAFETTADISITNAFKAVSDGHAVSGLILSTLERFVCQLYNPGTDISDLGSLRWWLFRRKQYESEKLPPTKAAFEESVKRAAFQCIIWNFDMVPNPPIPDPSLFGWKKDHDLFRPVMTTILPAPEALLELVKCGCNKTRCRTSRCKCRSNGLVCTELCSCGADIDACLNRDQLTD